MRSLPQPKSRIAIALTGLAMAVLAAPSLHAQGQASKPAKISKGAKALVFTPERESAALTFVARHHPELATLLGQLKPMNRAEYEQAVGELFQVSESLAQIKARDERRYELALDAWKAKSRVELLTAQLSYTSPGLEVELRAALEHQIDVEVRQQAFEREQAEARARKARESIERLERDRNKLVQSRLQHLKKKSQRAGRAVTTPPAPTRPKGERLP